MANKFTDYNSKKIDITPNSYIFVVHCSEYKVVKHKMLRCDGGEIEFDSSSIENYKINQFNPKHLKQSHYARYLVSNKIHCFYSNEKIANKSLEMLLKFALQNELKLAEESKQHYFASVEKVGLIEKQIVEHKKLLKLL